MKDKQKECCEKCVHCGNDIINLTIGAVPSMHYCSYECSLCSQDYPKTRYACRHCLQQPVEGWRERFDKKQFISNNTKQDIKSFISTLLAEQKARIVKELEEAINTIKNLKV